MLLLGCQYCLFVSVCEYLMQYCTVLYCTALQVLLAIRNISHNSEANIARLGAAGACEGVAAYILANFDDIKIIKQVRCGACTRGLVSHHITASYLHLLPIGAMTSTITRTSHSMIMIIVIVVSCHVVSCHVRGFWWSATSASTAPTTR